MPLTRKQFELGIDSNIEQLMKRIHAYLSQHKEQAFTKGEIITQLGVLDFRLCATALEKLVNLGAVEARIVRDTEYYALSNMPLDF